MYGKAGKMPKMKKDKGMPMVSSSKPGSTPEQGTMYRMGVAKMPKEMKMNGKPRPGMEM